jgi:hypothetical protein
MRKCNVYSIFFSMRKLSWLLAETIAERMAGLSQQLLDKARCPFEGHGPGCSIDQQGEVGR